MLSELLVGFGVTGVVVFRRLVISFGVSSNNAQSLVQYIGKDVRLR